MESASELAYELMVEVRPLNLEGLVERVDWIRQPGRDRAFGLHKLPVPCISCGRAC